MTKTPLPVLLLISVVLLLTGTGIVLVATASNIRAQVLYNSQHYFLIRQLIWVALALPVWIIASYFDYRIWIKYRYFTLTVCVLVLLALVAVITPGVRHLVNGSYRWLKLGPINVQPSEFAKFITVVGICVWLSHIGQRVRSFWYGIAIPSAWIGVVALLLFFEPDYGAIMVVGLCGFILMIIAGTRIYYIIPAALAGGVLLAAVVAKDPNRMRRITEFMTDVPYQVQQSLIAFKLGGVTGVGFTKSMQKHKYLPEAHTDFILSIGGEEFGYFFSLAVVIAYLTILVCGVIISKNAPDRFGKLIAFGMTFLLVFQAIWNIAMVTHCTITKGLALPFMSYGGTNIVVALAAVGTIVSVGRTAVDGRVVKNHFMVAD